MKTQRSHLYLALAVVLAGACSESIPGEMPGSNGYEFDQHGCILNFNHNPETGKTSVSIGYTELEQVPPRGGNTILHGSNRDLLPEGNSFQMFEHDCTPNVSVIDGVRYNMHTLVLDPDNNPYHMYMLIFLRAGTDVRINNHYKQHYFEIDWDSKIVLPDIMGS